MNAFHDVYNSLTTDKVKERSEGLQRLRKLLTDPSAPAISDKLYHRLIEVVFEIVVKEKNAYSRFKNSTKAGQILERASQAASVLRAIVERGISALRPKTISAITRHITQIGTGGDEFIDYIALDYIRALATICAYAPHVEHLSQEDWKSVAELCISGIERNISDIDIQRNIRIKPETVEMAGCLEKLMSSSNAPILAHSHRIYLALIKFLLCQPSETSAHRSIFYCVNKILSVAIVNHLDLYYEIALDMTKVVSSLWNTKLVSFKEQMIVTLVYLYPATQDRHHLVEFLDPMKSLVYVILTEYFGRISRDLLQLDDLSLTPSAKAGWLNLPWFSLASDKAVVPWMCLMLVARFSNFLDASVFDLKTHVPYAPTESASKRRRLIDSDSDGVDVGSSTVTVNQILAGLKSESEARQLTRLQLVSIMISIDPETANLQTSISILSGLVSSDNASIASWAMIALSALAVAPNSRNDSYSSDWLHVWELAGRRITSHSTCQGSCFLLEKLLALEIVPYVAVAATLDAIFISAEAIGPVSLNISSIRFWETCLLARHRASLKRSINAPERVAKWLVSKMTSAVSLIGRQVRHERKFRASDIPAIASLILRCCGHEASTMLQPDTTSCKFDTTALIEFLLQIEEDTNAVNYFVLAKSVEQSDKPADDVLYIAEYAPNLESQILDSLSMIFSNYISAEQSIGIEANEALFPFVLVALLVFTETAKQSWGKAQPTPRPKTFPIQQLISFIVSKINDDSVETEYVDEILSALSAIEGCLILTDGEDIELALASLEPICSALESHIYATSPFATHQPQDLRNEDFDFEHKRVSKRSALELSNAPRTWNIASASKLSDKYSTLINLRCQVLMWSTKEPFGEEILLYFARMSSLTLYISLPSILSVFGRVFTANNKTALVEKVLRLVGGKLFARHEYERTELVAIFCVHALNLIAPLWICKSEQLIGLQKIALDIYKWLVHLALDASTTSHKVRCVLGPLLLQIRELDINFRGEEKLPSPRSYFLQLLPDSEVRVSFHIANLMPRFCKDFDMSNHEQLYRDIHSVLENLTKSAEQLAVNVFTLSKLLVASPAMFRLAIFNLVEASAFESIRGHIWFCFTTAAAGLDLQGPHMLFDIAKSQICYSWSLMGMNIANAAWDAFGYQSQQQFIKSISAEYISMLVIGRSTELSNQLDFMCSVLSADRSSLVKKALPNILAYSCASHSDLQFVCASLKLKSGEFTKKCKAIASTALAVLLERTDLRDVSRHSFIPSGFTVDSEAWKRLFPADNTTKLLEPMQPYYTLLDILKAIKRLHRTISFVPNMGSKVYIARLILNMLDNCTNPFQKRRVLRVLKLHLALDPTNHGIYLEQMLLHAVIPLMEIPECTGDVMDIFNFLFTLDNLNGHPNLLIRFVLEMAFYLQRVNLECLETTVDVKIPTVMRFFECADRLIDNPEDTEDIRKWLNSVEIFSKTNQAGLSGWSPEAIKRVVLDREGVLDACAQKYALQLLALEVQGLRRAPEKLLPLDSDCVEIAPALLQLCREHSLNDDFIAWASQVCGRAYASSGIVPSEWCDRIDIYPRLAATHVPTDLWPISASIQTIFDLLDSDDRATVRLAEATLRKILPFLKEQNGELYESIQDHPVKEFEFNEVDVIWEEHISKKSASMPTDMSLKVWASRAASTICSVMTDTPNQTFYSYLPILLNSVDGFAIKVFPYLMHQYVVACNNAREVTSMFNECFRSVSNDTVQQASLLIRTFIYLQNQKLRDEPNELRRFTCIDGLDFHAMVKAALVCKMYSSAFLICECMWSLDYSPASLSEYLVQIYKSIDDPDALYGVSIAPSVEAVIDISEFENDGWRLLSYRGALLDESYRSSNGNDDNARGLISAFSNIGLNGLSLAVSNALLPNETRSEQTYESSWKLSQWDIPTDDRAITRHGIIYDVLRSVNKSDLAVSLTADNIVREPSVALFSKLVNGVSTVKSTREILQTLAVVTETWEMWTVGSNDDVPALLERFCTRSKWMEETRFDYSEDILLSRQIVFDALSRVNVDFFSNLRDSLRIANAVSLKAIACAARKHGQLQKALSLSMKLVELAAVIQPPYDVPLQSTGRLETSQVLWAKGESDVAIRMLKDSLPGAEESKDSLHGLAVSSVTILATLASWISDARLESPDSISATYFTPAIKSAEKLKDGDLRSHAFHEYALFCDRQLRSKTNIEDLSRIEGLRAQKSMEIDELKKLLENEPSQSEKKRILSHLGKVQKLFKSDSEEYTRLRENRNRYLNHGISFYLKSLAASDNYDEDGFRFCSIWLAHYADANASAAVIKLLDAIPVVKLVDWINQLSSRLSYEHPKSTFQRALTRIVTKICLSHPYHGLYQIYAIRAAGASADASSQSRIRAAESIWLGFKAMPEFHARYSRPVEQFCQKAIKLAQLKLARDKDATRSLSFDSLPDGQWWLSTLPTMALPPPAMEIPLRADCDYSGVPKITAVSDMISLAAGLSRPKICVCEASDGENYKMLIKGGNDDLRQDAIMEQVFGQVNKFLIKNAATKLRKMNVRTYKVIPLSHTAGIIEFVKHTISYQDAVQPLHRRYYPTDWDARKCREVIGAAVPKGLNEKVRVFKQVQDHVHPALRFFFLERFRSPREWLAKKATYTRGTAAISILGNAVGLGDRHCNNILFDTWTGEPVHIDLGVAFEQGRVLPLPELVPFRLTRDVIDGMGISGTEGIFRRCCEFMLQVLRDEADNIMTVLDVLKYDPLYSWTISPLRRKRIQDDEESPTAHASGSVATTTARSSNDSEAERALLTVSQKLSNSLSVGATVNQLIQEATDIKNLAILYSGWSAFY